MNLNTLPQDIFEQLLIERMVNFDLDFPKHRPWEEIVADVRDRVSKATPIDGTCEEITGA